MNASLVPAAEAMAIYRPADQAEGRSVVQVSPALDHLVAEFWAAHEGRVSVPEMARGWCVELSEAFVAVCEAVGVAATTITGARYGEVPEFPGVRLLLEAHTATRVVEPGGEVIVDWSARQFIENAPVPVVCSPQDWRTLWGPL